MSRYARVVAVLAVQIGILAAVPARVIWARRSGTAVTLRTAPVDPFDTLSGHYVTLSYEVEQGRTDMAGADRAEPLWITVAPGEPAWTLVSTTRVRPALKPGQVAIRAEREHDWATLPRLAGARRFYVSEARARAIEAAGRGAAPALVDLRVGSDGTPAIVAVRAGGQLFKTH